MSRRKLTRLSTALLALGFAHGALAQDQIEAKAWVWLKQMTLDEKIQMVHGVGMGKSPVGGASYIPGIPRLGIPALASADSSGGVGGLNVPDRPTTQFPAPLALAASWDPELAEAYGAQIATELRALGFGEGLGGGVNLAREPRNGRTFEYLGEDPLLAGKMLAARTRGTQSRQVIATIKHFAANDQETRRTSSNSVIDERTLRELTLLPFEIAVREGKPGNVMCAYNLVNGEKACQNRHLLTDILKGEWGFDGTAQSDWIFAVTDTVAAANAGLDEEEPGSDNDEVQSFGVNSHFNQRLKAAVESGAVPLSRLDDMVVRKLRILLRHGIVANPPRPDGVLDSAAGHALARKVAEQSMVLLKNDKATLPLDPKRIRSIAVIGGHADAGVLSGGGSGGAGVIMTGSSWPDNAVPCLDKALGLAEPMFSACATWFKSSPLAALRARAPGLKISYLDGLDAKAAADAAAAADVTLVFASQWVSEGMDLKSLALPNPATDRANQAYDQEALIRAVAARARRTVVVLENGTAVAMPWLDQVSAVLAAWYPGMEGGPALARVLFGDVNPSGRLPLSFPKSDADLPQKTISAEQTDVVYSERLKIGYRWYDAQNIAPQFPFGHGLSYTRFSYSGLHRRIAADGSVKLSFALKNTGKRRGAEVIQVYASLPESAGEPPQRLVAWKKVELGAGQSTRVEISIPRERLAIWNTQKHGWEVVAGSYRLRIARSSRDPHALSVQTRLGDAPR